MTKYQSRTNIYYEKDGYDYGKNHMDAERAKETIEMIVTEYNRIDVGIYISLLCKRYMDEYNMDEDELFFRLSNSMNRLLNEEK